MSDLKEDYLDDVLDVTKNTKRRYRMIQNKDGTVSFEDVTDYSQIGDSFGAKDVNAINEAINGLSETIGYSSKNLLDCSGLVETTNGGVTFTPVYNENGGLEYIEVNGTNTVGRPLTYQFYSGMPDVNIGDDYIFTACPKGGAVDTFYASWQPTNGIDNGDGITFTAVDRSQQTQNYYAQITIYMNYTANELRFYPMIRKAEIEDPTYEPYYKVEGLKDRVEYLESNKADSTHTHHASDVLTQYHLLEDGQEPPVGGTYTVDSELSRYATKISKINSDIGELENNLNNIRDKDIMAVDYNYKTGEEADQDPSSLDKELLKIATVMGEINSDMLYLSSRGNNQSTVIDNIDNLNKTTSCGGYWIQRTLSQGNHPFDAEYYYLYVPHEFIGRVQIAISYGNRTIKARMYVNNAWTNWTDTVQEICNNPYQINKDSTTTIDLSMGVGHILLLCTQYGGLYRVRIYSTNLTTDTLIKDDTITLTLDGCNLKITCTVSQTVSFH